MTQPAAAVAAAAAAAGDGGVLLPLMMQFVTLHIITLQHEPLRWCGQRSAMPNDAWSLDQHRVISRLWCSLGQDYLFY